MKWQNVFSLCIFFLFLCFVSSACAVGKTTPGEPMDSLVLSMSTDNTEIFDGAITFATVALKRGHEVSMLLRLDAIKPAVAKNSYPVRNTTLEQELITFMKNGGRVISGGKCIKDMGLKPTDLLPGVVVGTPDDVMGMIFKKDTKIVSY